MKVLFYCLLSMSLVSGAALAKPEKKAEASASKHWFEKNAERLSVLDLLDRLSGKDVVLYLSNGDKVYGELRGLQADSDLKGLSDPFLNIIFLKEKGSLKNLIAIDKRMIVGLSASMDD